METDLKYVVFGAIFVCMLFSYTQIPSFQSSSQKTQIKKSLSVYKEIKLTLIDPRATKANVDKRCTE